MDLGTRACLALPQCPVELGGEERRRGEKRGGEERRRGGEEEGRRGNKGERKTGEEKWSKQWREKEGGNFFILLLNDKLGSCSGMGMSLKWHGIGMVGSLCSFLGGSGGSRCWSPLGSFLLP